MDSNHKEDVPRQITNIPIRVQSYNAPSPNEMVVDTDDYVDDTTMQEKDEVAIINPDTLDAEADQLQDLPLANDCTSETNFILSGCSAISHLSL